MRHKSKGWANKRRRSKCRSKINVHKNKWKKSNNKVDSKKCATTTCVHDVFWPITQSNHKHEAFTVLLVVKFALHRKFLFQFWSTISYLSEAFWIKKWIDKYKYIDDSIPIFNISAQSKSNIRNSVWVSYVRNSCSFFTFQEHARYIFH